MSYVDVEFMAIYVGPKYNYISCSYECSMYIRALTSRGLQFHFGFLVTVAITNMLVKFQRNILSSSNYKAENSEHPNTKTWGT
jgi:hypothetical protein